jgi:hypothetical protein
VADQQGLDIGKAVAQQMAAQAPVAQITVVMLANGHIQAQCKVPSPQVMLMMLEQAKLDLYQVFREQAKKAAEPAIETPNPQGVLVAG